MHLLLGLMVGVAVLLALALIPLLIFAGIFAILLHLVLLPFKLFGWGLKLGVGLAGALAKLLILRKIALPRFAIRHDFVVKRCSVLTDGEPVPAVADVLTVRIFFGVGLQLVHRVLVFTGKEGGEGESIVHIFNALALRKFTEVFFVFDGGFIVLARHEFGIAK